MKPTLISVLAAFLISSPALADTFSMGPPEKVGLSSERLQPLTSALKAEVEKGRLPGVVLAVARKGQLAYIETLGYRDAATKAPMPRDAIFSIASMTKPMVSVAIMMLHDEGKLFLSDPVGKFLPQLAKMQVGVVKNDASGKETVETVPASRQPTIQDLLRHTSGFTYGARGTTAVHKLWPASSSISVAYRPPSLSRRCPRRRCSINRAPSGTTACRPTSSASSWRQSLANRSVPSWRNASGSRSA